MSITQVENPTINPSDFEPINRKDGISGLMRVRNEAEFLAPVIESWIDYVDELVIVFHQCTDKTPQIIEEFAEKYPQKIRAFHYLPQVYSFCSQEQLELDDNNIHSFVFYSNFGLSQTRYKICVKIDGDHIGIPEHLKSVYKFFKDYPVQNTALFFSGVNLHQVADDERYYINLKSPAGGDGDHAYWTVSSAHIFQKNPQLPFCESTNFAGLNSYYLGFIYWHTNALKKHQPVIHGRTILDREIVEKINNLESQNQDKPLVLLSPEFKQKNKDFQNTSYPRFPLYFDFGSLPDVTEIDLVHAQLNQLGVSQTKAPDENTAIADYEQAIAHQPDLWQAYYNLGIGAEKQEQWSEAIASYHQALKLNPQNWEIYTRLGRLYQIQNQIPEAISVYRQGLTLLNPHYATAVAAYENSGISQEILPIPPIPDTKVTVGAYQFPQIPPVTNPDQPRPFWTVVIPVYNRAEYLLECLASVLVQWSGAENMEILVMDNASTSPLFDLVHSIAGGIVHYYRQQQNIGGIGNYNAGISLSRGHWVHVLHDDDCVVPGFYEHLQQSLETCPDSVGVACTGFEYINENGEALDTGEVVSLYGENKGIMQDWLPRIGICGLVTVPAMVIRRSAHERLGGYYPNLPEIGDWEIFKRFASFYDWWYQPGILARYREHTRKLTPTNWLSGRMPKAIRHAIEVSDTYFPVEMRAEITAKARRQNFNYCLTRAKIPLLVGNLTGALSVLQEALKIDSSPECVAKLFAWLTQDQAASLRSELIFKLFSIQNENTDHSISSQS